MAVGRFYAGIGALIRNPINGNYLILQRSVEKDFASGDWECITGRVDQGESFSQALQREVYEELGITVQIDFIVGTIHFHRGEASAENELVGVQYCCSLEDPEAIAISDEHSRYRWVTAGEARELLPEGHWLRETILRAEAIRALSHPGLLDYYHQSGFEG